MAHPALPLVSVQQKPLHDEWARALDWAEVRESRCAPAVCELGFHDPRFGLPAADAQLRLGAQVQLFVPSPEDSRGVELFTGEITGFEVRSKDGRTCTVLHAEDRSHRLRRGRRVAVYVEKSASEIAAQLARQAGIDTQRIDETPIVYKRVSQVTETDWDFLNRLARENDREAFVRAGSLRFQPVRRAGTDPSSKDPTVLQYGRNLLAISSTTSLRDQVSKVQVRGWDPDRGQAIAAVSEVKGAPSPWASGASLVKGESLLLNSVPRTDQHSAETVADAMAREVASSRTSFRAEVIGAPELRLRSAVKLAGFGEGFDSTYTITSTRHRFGRGTRYLTEVTVHNGQPEAADGHGGRTGDPETVAPRMPGLVCATVSNIQDPEKQGRVQLKFPWLDEDYVSDWARTAQLGGHAGGGIVCPEVGDEVLVGFEQGCLDRPYVIGGLYNQRHKPRKHQVGDLYDGSKGATNVRSFVSRTGQRMELLDADGGPTGVLLATGDGKLRIDLDQSSTTVVIKSDGEVSIKSKKISLEGDDISLDAKNGRLSLAGQQVAVKAQTNVAVDAQANVSLSGNGICTIKGSVIKLN
ncbi:VgrG-related protein [Streptomyces sp. AV19]|uniref:VgrG-related protein n=1 Tax=Streptomyces sp. AV19 TaxID=2793068 RepID=UPI0018FEBA85|nr:VgrG-related protein [Streptomyces sp. AV19]MBH1939185.1 VgrG-related protein [Streptomyces sp. AV19]MDG4536915.1 VgrG-related protein [Streptomyces sp. AV19]